MSWIQKTLFAFEEKFFKNKKQQIQISIYICLAQMKKQNIVFLSTIKI